MVLMCSEFLSCVVSNMVIACHTKFLLSRVQLVTSSTLRLLRATTNKSCISSICNVTNIDFVDVYINISEMFT